MSPTNWKETRAARLSTIEAITGYNDAHLRFEFAQQVRELREQRGLSQADLANIMGTTQSAISRLEGGGVAPNIKTLHKVASALQAEVRVTLVPQ